MYKKFPWLWLLALAASVSYFLITYSGLPERVATHFDLSGAPNGFMTKDGYLSFFITFTLFLNVLFGVLFLFLKKIPFALVNVPRKDYWAANPERMVALHQRLGAVLALIATFMNCVFLFTVQIVYQANTSDATFQIPLNGGVFFILLGSVFMVIFAFLILRPPQEA